VWFRDPVDPDKVSFEADVFFKMAAERLKDEKSDQPVSSLAAPMPMFAQVLESASALRPDVLRSEATSTPATVEPAIHCGSLAVSRLRDRIGLGRASCPSCALINRG